MSGSENPQNRDGSDDIAENLGATDAASLEGPDVEVSEDDVPGGSEVTDEGGLGQDGTIPDHPNGVGLGHTGEASTFEPEEDESA
jgi:hypothetical protein